MRGQEERIEQIQLTLQAQETESLLEIWAKKDRQTWAPEAFEAIRRILMDRMGSVPDQPAQSALISGAPEQTAASESTSALGASESGAPVPPLEGALSNRVSQQQQSLQGLSWIRICLKAGTHPSISFFEALAADSRATLGRAIGWTFVAWLICYTAVVVLVGGWTLVTGASAAVTMSSDELLTLGGIATVILPAGALVATAFQFVALGLVHLFAWAFGGTGSYRQLAYVNAAYQLPYVAATLVGSLIPCVSFVVSIYGAVLTVMAIRAVHRLGTGRAVAALLVAGAVFIGALLLVVLLLGTPLDPLWRWLSS